MPADRQSRTRLRELAEARRRFGYRRLQVLLRREGRPRGRKRSAVRQPLPDPKAINQVWSMHFMTDAFSSGLASEL
jgi:putative transposase